MNPRSKLNRKLLFVAALLGLPFASAFSAVDTAKDQSSPSAYSVLNQNTASAQLDQMKSRITNGGLNSGDIAGLNVHDGNVLGSAESGVSAQSSKTAIANPYHRSPPCNPVPQNVNAVTLTQNASGQWAWKANGQAIL